MVSYRYLGRSGLKISEIAYGNWLTHGSQVENDAAHACVRAALDAGITTFDTADVYANTKAETVLGEALQGRATRSRWRSSQGLLADRPRRRTTTRPVPQAHPRVDRRLAAPAADRLRRPLPGAPLRHRRPRSRRRCRRSPTSCAPGKALYIGVSEWTADQIRAGHALATELGIQLISNQPQYSMLWRVIEAEVVPTSAELGLSPDRLVADRAGRADRQVPAGPGAARPARGPPTRRAAPTSSSGFIERRRAARGCRSCTPIADELGLSMAQLAVAWVLQNDERGRRDHRRLPAGAGARERQGGRRAIPAEVLARIDDVLGDSVVSDPAETAKNAPPAR